jgi:hypothetical protein
MQVLQKMFKINNYLWDLYASIAMDVKNQQLLRNLYVGTTMDVKK